MLMRPVSTFGLAGPKDAADVASESDVFWTCSEGFSHHDGLRIPQQFELNWQVVVWPHSCLKAAIKRQLAQPQVQIELDNPPPETTLLEWRLEAAAPFAVWRRLSLIFILAAVLCCAVQQSFASDGYMGASMDELLGEAVEPKPDKGKAKAKAPAAAAFVSAKASAPAAAPAPVPPSSGRNSTSSEGSADGSVGVTCPKTRHVRHCISGRILYLTTISYEGDSCSRKKKVKRTRADRNCPIGTKYSRTKCSRSGYRIETSLTVYLDDCVCKRRKLSTKKRCTPECKPATQRTRCIDNSLYRIESGEKVVNFACTAYTKQVALKPDCTVGVRKKPGTCRGLFMTVTELRTTYRNCRCRTTRKRVRVRCACPKTKVRTRCDGNVKMRISTVYRLKRNSCKVETKVKRIPISCPKNRVKSRSSCRADCSQTVTETWAEVRNCRCVRPVKKRTVKCCCPKPQRNSYCRGSVLHSMVRRFQLRGGRCKEKVKVTKKPIVCNKKYRPVKSSCAFNGYRRVILYNQERRGCECVKRRRITYEKCGCGKDYTTEKCDDNVWIVKAVTHKMDGAKSACKRSVAVRKKPIKCRGKLHRRVSRCQSDGYRVVRQLVEEARDCVCVTRVTSHRERCRCEKSRIEHECRGNRVYKHRYVQHLVDGRCLLKRTTSVVRIKCGENTVKSSDCVKGWRTKTYVNYYPYNCKCLKRVYNRQVRCACPKNRTKTRCIRGVLVKLEKKYEMKDGQCIGHLCKITRRVHCPRKFEVKRGKCTKKQRIVTTRETRRRNCKCKSVVKRTKEVCGCPRPVHRRVCSADQVETIYSTKYKLVDGLCLAEEDEKVIPNKCPSKPLYRRGRCGSDGSRVDTWVHHSLRKCVCHQRVKRLRLRC
uniref:VWFA domain-containing protein n=1 Tax=Macrostomum lignano TaxID=282301 RepID=A0A1I8IWZ4_9PLAT